VLSGTASILNAGDIVEGSETQDRSMSTPFIKGMQLSRLFFEEAVRPILAERFAGLAYSAARLGPGSDVLGFDTPRSMDHHWGPKTELFVLETDHARYAAEIVRVLGETLPFEFHGYPTHFATPEISGGILTRTESRPIHHGVTVHTPAAFFTRYLGRDPRQGMRVADWLVMPEQFLRTIASGQVFHDGLGELERVRERLRYYPRDVWLYLLAAQWRRIDQEEPFMARCGDVGDDLGSRIVAARLVRDMMKLCFLMEQQYAPYVKWFGTAFAQLRCAGLLTPIFHEVLNAPAWQARERALSAAYETLAEMHNRLGITPPLPARVSPFHDRPYLVIHSGLFVSAIRDAIRDEAVRRLPPFLGSVDQFADSTDVLSDATQVRKLTLMYPA
jgi:hypothetical protein